MNKMQTLSKNQQIIFDLIDKSPEPMKAYAILFNVQKKGIKAPLQVYRALDKLVEIGKIHKIESRNAFIACQNSSCQVSKATAFSICEICEKVTEISSAGLSKYLANFKDKDGMKYSKLSYYLKSKQNKLKGKRMFIKKYLKWISTFLVLVGILLTNLNIYPLNIYFHGLGVVGWTIAGFVSKDKAILTNFGLQIPLFVIGIYKIII